MFGPDVCGSTKRVHFILNYKGQNHLIKREVRPETDVYTHLYTAVIFPNQTYEVHMHAHPLTLPLSLASLQPFHRDNRTFEPSHLTTNFFYNPLLTRSRFFLMHRSALTTRSSSLVRSSRIGTFLPPSRSPTPPSASPPIGSTRSTLMTPRPRSPPIGTTPPSRSPTPRPRSPRTGMTSSTVSGRPR